MEEKNEERTVEISKSDFQKYCRFEESKLRLETIHHMRWWLLSAFPEVNDEATAFYVEGNEMLTEVEKEVWSYINGESKKF